MGVKICCMKSMCYTRHACTHKLATFSVFLARADPSRAWNLDPWHARQPCDSYLISYAHKIGWYWDDVPMFRVVGIGRPLTNQTLPPSSFQDRPKHSLPTLGAYNFGRMNFLPNSPWDGRGGDGEEKEEGVSMRFFGFFSTRPHEAPSRVVIMQLDATFAPKRPLAERHLQKANKNGCSSRCVAPCFFPPTLFDGPLANDAET